MTSIPPHAGQHFQQPLSAYNSAHIYSTNCILHMLAHVRTSMALPRLASGAVASMAPAFCTSHGSLPDQAIPAATLRTGAIPMVVLDLDETVCWRPHPLLDKVKLYTGLGTPPGAPYTHAIPSIHSMMAKGWAVVCVRACLVGLGWAWVTSRTRCDLLLAATGGSHSQT